MVISSKKTMKRFFIFLSICTAVMAAGYIRIFTMVPGRITLLEGREYVYNWKSFLFVSIKADKSGIVALKSNERPMNESALPVNEAASLKRSRSFSLKAVKQGTVGLSMKILGLIPIKTMQVDIVPDKKIMACGNTVGVRLKLDGILVIGVSDVETAEGRKQPVKDGNIKAGDLIVEVNNRKIYDTDELIEEIEKSRGKGIAIKYMRGNTLMETTVYPVLSKNDDRYRLGMWVRDSTAGIGTLTFYDPETRTFGALGHGITDVDTGTLMPVKEGELLESNILSVVKGKAGSPGELKGVFVEGKKKLGSILKNTEYGIYGVFYENFTRLFPGKQYPIGLRHQIKVGPAKILANISGKKVEEYDIEIVKTTKQSFTGSKGMVLKITDKRLLENTGGIVQGMSGSPIIQDGRIIGAVTHVLVNDPTRGYGIYIEWMLKKAAECVETTGDGGLATAG